MRRTCHHFFISFIVYVVCTLFVAVNVALVDVLRVSATPSNEKDMNSASERFSSHCKITFAEQFSVTTGTTISFSQSSASSLFSSIPLPITQSGAIYVDTARQMFRVDQFAQGYQYSFLADYRLMRGYVFQQVVAGEGAAEGDSSAYTMSHCRPVPLSAPSGNGYRDQRIPPLCVPHGYQPASSPSSSTSSSSSDEQEEWTPIYHVVRGVPTTRYEGYDRLDHYHPCHGQSQHGGCADEYPTEDVEGPLVKVHYYVVHHNFSSNSSVTIPWRLEMLGGADIAGDERDTAYVYSTPPAYRRAIADAPLSMPNWRYFGDPLFGDEIVQSWKAGSERYEERTGNDSNDAESPSDRALTVWFWENLRITMDFFNFVTTPPPSAVFHIPEVCLTEPTANYGVCKDGDDDCKIALPPLPPPENATSIINLALTSQRMWMQWGMSLIQKMENATKE